MVKSIKIKDLKDLLLEYYQRLYPEKEIFDVDINEKKDIELELINRSLHSEIYKVPSPIRYNLQSKKTGMENKEEIFYLKQPLSQSSLADKIQKHKREVDVFTFLSSRTDSLPRCYGCIDKKGLEILVGQAGDKVVGKFFRKLTDIDKCVLADIAANQPVHNRVLSKERKYGSELDTSLLELMDIGFIALKERDDHYVLGSNYSSRFDFTGELVEKQAYTDLKRKVFAKVLEKIFTFQDVALAHLNSNQLIKYNIPKMNRNNCGKRAVDKLKETAIYISNEKKDLMREFENDKEKIKELYSKDIGAFMEYETKNVIQGDYHPGNILFVENDGDIKVNIIDFYHICMGPWLYDISAFLIPSKINCGVTDSEYEHLLSEAFVKREDLIKQGKFPGETEETIRKLKRFIDIDRTLYDLGSNSHVLLNKPMMKENEKRNLQNERKGYLDYLNRALENTKECSNELKDLVIKYTGLK